MKAWKHGDVKKIKLLGSRGKINFKQTAEGLNIIIPEKVEAGAAHVFQITCNNLHEMPCTIAE